MKTNNNYDKGTFEEMIRNFVADNAEEMGELEIEEATFNEETQEWEAIAYGEKTTHVLTDDGTGNIVINYLGTR